MKSGQFCSSQWRILLNTLAVIVLSSRSIRMSFNTYNDHISVPSEFPPESRTSESIPIFYNLYVKDKKDAPRVYNLVSQQLAQRRPEHNPIYVHSIGYNVTIPNTIVIQHHDIASEIVTLHSLWKYCRNHPNEKVIYLHSKGSFSNTATNEKLRKFLTTGALSLECSNLPSTCNVCSSRFSPLPHPHTSGNMWLARCEYVKGLVDPSEMAERMETVVTKLGLPQRHLSCDGRLRFSSEHWIASSPSAKPCDLYVNRSFTWGYDLVPDDLYPNATNLKTAPRYALNVFVKRRTCKGRGIDIQQRLEEYQELYDVSLPDETWWGWKAFKKNYRDFQLRLNSSSDLSATDWEKAAVYANATTARADS
jgi:hypothetical protein